MLKASARINHNARAALKTWYKPRTCTHIQTIKHMYAAEHARKQAHRHTRSHARICACTHACMCTYARTHACTHMFAPMRARTRSQARDSKIHRYARLTNHCCLAAQDAACALLVCTPCTDARTHAHVCARAHACMHARTWLRWLLRGLVAMDRSSICLRNCRSCSRWMRRHTVRLLRGRSDIGAWAQCSGLPVESVKFV